MAYTLCLDPGHGGIDSGAIVNGLKESEVALQLTLLTGDIVLKHGVNLIYTRKTDVNVDLDTRAAIANDAGVDYFISIHANSAVPTAKGTETYAYAPGGKGEQLARSIQEAIVNSGITTANRGVKFANFAVLRETVMPAALLETLFISNAEDAVILKTRKQDIAKAIAKGILKFLGIQYNPDLVNPKPAVMYRVILDGVQVEALSYIDKAEQEVKNAVDSGKAKSGKVQRNTDGVDIFFYPPSNNNENKTLIMGKSDLVKEQMIKYVEDNNKAPKLSVTVEQLVELFLNEGEEEGVRGDIAFCQAIEETGFFNYGGNILPEQNNFGGLGAVRQSTRGQGAWFVSATDGVRAQIQHLKAYGSTEPLKNQCIDPRFSLVTRGIAPYWEDLDGKWAVPGNGYGESILEIYKKIKEIKVEVTAEQLTLIQIIINFFINLFNSVFKKSE